MSDLGIRRRLFTKLLPRLIDRMIEEGYEPMLGKDGEKHMVLSLHYEGLAVDIDLTKDGKVFEKTEDYTIFGVFWESLNPLCCWGGRFSNPPDGRHFSITYGGRK
jgi:hypothetical protein